MSKQLHARIQGIGLHSSIGSDVAASLEALNAQPPSYQSEQLGQFIDPLHAARLTAALGNGIEESTDALGKLKGLLDSAIHEALEGVSLSDSQRSEMPVYIGSSSYGIAIAEEYYANQLSDSLDSTSITESAMAVPLDGFGQISQHLQETHKLLGPDYCYNTACTASANALLSASQAIRAGLHENALVIGIELKNLTTLAGFASMQLLADGPMQPFDAHRNGLVLAEGCAAILLSASTEQQGLTLSGGASLSDSYSISASNPDGSEIAKAMQLAINDADITLNDIKAIKAHGTATPLNDTGEAAALHRVFQTLPPIVCLKPHLGHTLGACGAIEFAVLAAGLKNGTLCTSNAKTETDPTLNITPLADSNEATDGFYMLNYFGFGGNNCSLILQRSLS